MVLVYKIPLYLSKYFLNVVHNYYNTRGSSTKHFQPRFSSSISSNLSWYHQDVEYPTVRPQRSVNPLFPLKSPWKLWKRLLLETGSKPPLPPHPHHLHVFYFYFSFLFFISCFTFAFKWYLLHSIVFYLSVIQCHMTFISSHHVLTWR